MAHVITIDSAADMLNQHSVVFSQQIKQAFRQQLEFERILTFVECDETYTAPSVSISDVLQPYQSSFTPNNAETFNGVDNRLRPIKLDLEFAEGQLEKFYSKWKVEWAEMGKDPMTYTYPRYIYDMVIVPKMLEELNTLAWLGEYVAPTPGTPGAYLDAQDGFKKRITDAISDGDLTPVNSGSFTASDIQSKLEAWLDAIPSTATSRGGRILMSKSNARKYYRDYRSEFNQSPWEVLQNNAQGTERRLMVDDYNVEIIGISAMENSNRWIFLPANDQNMIIGTRRGYPVYPQLIFDTEPRKLQMYATIYRFFGFEYWDNLYVNDQA